MSRPRQKKFCRGLDIGVAQAVEHYGRQPMLPYKGAESAVDELPLNRAASRGRENKVVVTVLIANQLHDFFLFSLVLYQHFCHGAWHIDSADAGFRLWGFKKHGSMVAGISSGKYLDNIFAVQLLQGFLACPL